MLSRGISRVSTLQAYPTHKRCFSTPPLTSHTVCTVFTLCSAAGRRQEPIRHRAAAARAQHVGRPRPAGGIAVVASTAPQGAQPTLYSPLAHPCVPPSFAHHGMPVCCVPLCSAAVWAQASRSDDGHHGAARRVASRPRHPQSAALPSHARHPLARPGHRTHPSSPPRLSYASAQVTPGRSEAAFVREEGGGGGSGRSNDVRVLKRSHSLIIYAVTRC